MKNTLKKAVALLLVLVFVLSLTACGNKGGEEGEPAPAEIVVDDTPAAEAQQEVDVEAYNADSATIYDNALGEFYATYQKANETDDVSTKYALMAIAEAKLQEAALMIPIYSRGGNYAIGRVAPYTISPSLWGNDQNRFQMALVTTEPLTTEDRDALKGLWKDLAGTGTYLAEAKAYLEGKGYTLKDTYSLTYNSDPVTFDTLSTSRAADAEITDMTYDRLFEYDVENVLQPAIATGYTVSDDELTYTFTIREGVEWVDSQGRKVADLTADDFVAGIQHAMDAQGGLEYLYGAGYGYIAGADDYIADPSIGFESVGVKALDDYTLEITLSQPNSYFNTMWTYSIFAPMSRSYYESKGGKFGVDFDAAAEDYTYGTTADDIAYCGPYLITSITAENSIVYTANPTYWNADGINIHSITMLYNDGSDPTKAYYDMQEGTIDACGLNSSALEIAKGDGWFDKYEYVTSNDATSFMGFYNLNRTAFSNATDNTLGISTQTVTDAQRTGLAMKNVHFRRALSFAFDRVTYNAQSVGDELAAASLRNSYVPGNFVSLENDVTVDINGTSTTFPAGTYYGEIMQAQIDADGVKIKVWDPTAESGIGSGDGFDGWYNVDNAVEELNIAIAELAEQGVEISAENPIYIDMPCYSASTSRLNQSNAYKQSVESALGGAVIVNLVEFTEAMDWYYAGYYTDYGYEANYDMYDVSGWGPDYGDPSTYLNTMLPEYNGYMVKCLGIY